MRSIEKWWDRMPSSGKFICFAIGVVAVSKFIDALIFYAVIFFALL